VLPFYARLDLPVQTILTDNGASSAAPRVIPTSSTWRSTTSTPQRTRVGSPRTNGFVERFNGTVLEEFFRPTMRRQLYESVEALQADLDAWLHHYNHERPHLGYRNQVAGRGRLSSCSSASHPQDKEVKKIRQSPGQRRHRRAGRGASPRARGVPYRNQHGRADHHRTRRRLG
jgi:hypothetical protein